MTVARFRHVSGALFGLLLTTASAFSAPDLVLDVSLDPQSRQFKAEAELQVTKETFRFLLHESLRVTSASAGVFSQSQARVSKKRRHAPRASTANAAFSASERPKAAS